MDDAAIEAEVERRVKERLAAVQPDMHPDRKAELDRGLAMLASAALEESEGRMRSDSFRRGNLYASLPSTRDTALLVGRDMGIETED